MNKNKVIILDYGIFSHRAGYASVHNPNIPVPYTCFRMMLACLKRIGITPDDNIIVACDGRNIWRKQYSTEYKSGRKEQRQKSGINWDKLWKQFDGLLEDIEIATNWTPIKIKTIEADDIMACFLGNTYIASPLKNSEERKIKNIKVGDKVYSYNLKKDKVELSTVKIIYKRKINKIKVIYFDNKTKVSVTENHRFYLINNRWTKAKDLKVGDEIYYLNSFNKNKYILMKPKIKNYHSLYRIGYICGAIESDGYLDEKHNRICFNINDRDYVMRLKSYFKQLFNYSVSISKKNKTYRILIGNKLIYDIILGYINKKSKQKESFSTGYISGFFDGEGCLKQYNHSLDLSMSNTNKEIINFISKKLKVKHKIYERKNNSKGYKKLYLIKINRQQEILNFYAFYKPAIKRKYPNWNDFAKYLHNGKKIIKIEEKINNKKGYTVYNLNIEPNNNYFANNLLVHNCASRFYKDREVILVTYDSDMEQLWNYPNVKIFSPKTKMYKIPPKNFNPYKHIAKKIEKETSDGLISPIITTEDYETRKMLVNLLELPDFIEQPIIEQLKKINQYKTELNVSALPFKSLRKQFYDIYETDNILTFEQCVVKQEKKQARLKKKKEKQKALAKKTKNRKG